AALDALDWAAVPIGHHATETGHGRTERRTIRVLDAPDHITSIGAPPRFRTQDPIRSVPEWRG
ncbi:MAG: hypothetical protein ACRDTD_26740, partial [Pseudonocardiaceae bacterium]